MRLTSSIEFAKNNQNNQNEYQSLMWINGVGFEQENDLIRKQADTFLIRIERKIKHIVYHLNIHNSDGWE